MSVIIEECVPRPDTASNIRLHVSHSVSAVDVGSVRVELRTFGESVRFLWLYATPCVSVPVDASRGAVQESGLVVGDEASRVVSGLYEPITARHITTRLLLADSGSAEAVCL